MRARPGYLVVLCLLAALLFAAAGCGSDDDNGNAADTATTETTATTDTTVTTDEGTTTTGTDEDEDTTTSTTGNEDTGTTGDEDEDEGGGGRGADVDSIVLRLSGNRVVCGTDEQNDRSFLICFQPATGATVRLGPSGVPKSSLVEDNKGVPAGASGAPVMRKGAVITSGDYRCTFQNGAVRCTNPAGHGFLIGGTSIFRF